VQPVEVPDVPVQRSDGDDGPGIQQTRSEHRAERVEVGVPMRGDDLLGAHRLILAEALGSDVRDSLYLDERAAGETGDLHGRSRRRAVADVRRVDVVHGGEVPEIH